MANTPETVNEVIVHGRLISIRDGRNSDEKYITVFSSSGRDVYVRFYCKGVNIPTDNNHPSVCVKGHVESYTHRTNGRYVTDQQFVADSIEPSKTMVEEKYGIKGKFYTPHDVQIYLKGTVNYIQKDGDWYRYTIEVPGKKRSNTIRVNARELSRHPNVQKGDVLCTVCSLSTPKKVLDGKTVYFENIIVNDLALA